MTQLTQSATVTREGYATANTDTNRISLKARLIKGLLALTGARHRLEKAVDHGRFSSEAAPLPGRMTRRYPVHVDTVEGRTCWTIGDISQTKQVVLYIHGGGYITNITSYDWKFIDVLIEKTGATFVVPDYPLAPAANCADVYHFFSIFYGHLLQKVRPDQLVVMGNSAGGGIALGFAQYLRQHSRPQPARIVLNSPLLDISMTNPDIPALEKYDKALSAEGIRKAGRLYAAGRDVQDYQVSPLYGSLDGLAPIALFIGTHDILVADARRLKSVADADGISIAYVEYPRMFHLWMVLPSLPESKRAIRQLTDWIGRAGGNSDAAAVLNTDDDESRRL